jgi:signal transduction histidine kinase
MMRVLVLSVAPLLAAFCAFGMQPPFRRRQKWERTLATEWIAGVRVPALAVLPTTGAIVEANDEARRLFLGRPLLEIDLFALLPAYHAPILDGLSQAQQAGAASIPVHLNGSGPMSLVLSTPAPNHPLLVAMLLPAAQHPVEFTAPPARDATFSPFTLPAHWTSLPIEKQISLYLQETVDQWPLAGAAVFRRRGMELSRLVTTIDNLPWDSLDLPAIALGSLFHGGDVIGGQLGPHSLLLHPLYLPSERQPWGAIALAPRKGIEKSEELIAAAATVATVVSLLLAQTRSQSGQEAKNRKIRQLVALRDHLLSRIRRGVLLLDEAGRIESINATASTMLGWPIEDVAGRPIAPLLDELGPLGEKIAAALSAPPTERQTASARLRPPGKRGRDVSFTVERVTDSTAEALIYLDDHEGLVDVTETQHHLDRLAVLGKMSAMIAHDLRNPLSSILLGIETLAEEFGEESPHAEHIQLLLGEGERVHRIIEDILSISRQPSLTISLCSLRALMDQVHDTLHRQTREKEIRVRRYYDPSVPLIEGDSVRLGQMLNNLLSNAIDAVPHGGQIEIALRPLALDQVIARGLNPDQEGRFQGGVEILIRDNGPGISESNRDQIFEPLFTTKGNGTGLGLPIVRTIVEQHRGMLFLDSEVGKGTTFQIFLPQLAISAR